MPVLVLMDITIYLLLFLIFYCFAVVVFSFYFPDFLLLSSLHNIWQLSAIVLPPSCQGVIWSASISFSSKCSPHFMQIPFCLSYASRFSLSLKARILKYFSFRVKVYE